MTGKQTMLLFGILGVMVMNSSNVYGLHGYHSNHLKDIKSFGPALPHSSYYVFENPHSPQTNSNIADIISNSLEYNLNDYHFVSSDSSELQPALDSVQMYIANEWGLRPSDYKVTDIYKSGHNGVAHIYLRQVVNGLEIINSNANFNVDKANSIISVGSSFYSKSKFLSMNTKHSSHVWSDDLLMKWNELKNSFSELKGIITNQAQQVINWNNEYNLSKTTQSRQHAFSRRGILNKFTRDQIGAEDALKSLSVFLRQDLTSDTVKNLFILADNVDGEPILEIINVPKDFALDEKVQAKPTYIRLENGTLAPVWDLTVEQEEHWWHAHVDANTGKVHSLVDWVNNASYDVFPLGTNDPAEGNRAIVLNPADKKASPNGWHSSSPDLKSKTVGNNVWAQENHEGGSNWQHNYRPDGGISQNFNFPFDHSYDPKQYLDTAITQLFYTNNMIHDLFYHYGFNEKAGNFQDDNFDRGGRGGDAVIANAQDGSGYNNANFATPPDGRHPKMRMYIWNVVNPNRDGDLESGIVIHEYSHGISIRLTGGPMNSGCLGWGESGGMGEGWGDFFATVIRTKAHHTRHSDFTMGEYSAGRGIRHYSYSTSISTNPSTYAFLDKPAYWGVHAKGEVWAEILYELYWNLIDKHGFTKDLFSHDLQYGNTLTLQLVVDGLKLQPCYPGFTDARDAILLADNQLTGGENQCEIWAAFSKRGLGPGAAVEDDTPWGGGRRVESFSKPDSCL